MAKEITLELLTEAVKRLGVAAARAFVDAACVEIDMATEKTLATIIAAESELEKLRNLRSMLQALLKRSGAPRPPGRR